MLKRQAQPARHSERGAFWLTVAAFLWSAGLFTVGAATLTEQNGARILAVLAVPVTLTTLAWVALHREHTRHSPRTRLATWSSISLLLVFSLLTGFSIGLFVLPTVGLLIAAALRTSRHAQ